MRLLNAKLLFYSGVVFAVALLAGCGKPIPPGTPRIKIVMRKYAIDPPEIHLKQGQLVVLDVSSADVQHGFRIKELGINESVRRFFPAEILLTPQKKGSFMMDCSILCGRGHDDMLGKVIVE